MKSPGLWLHIINTKSVYCQYLLFDLDQRCRFLLNAPEHTVRASFGGVCQLSASHGRTARSSSGMNFADTKLAQQSFVEKSEISSLD